jgi:hypothetical protein
MMMRQCAGGGWEDQNLNAVSLDSCEPSARYTTLQKFCSVDYNLVIGTRDRRLFHLGLGGHQLGHFGQPKATGTEFPHLFPVNH